MTTLKWPAMTLRVRLFFLVIAALTPLLAMQGYNQVVFRQERRLEVERMAQLEAKQVAGEVGQIVAGMRKFLLAAANRAQSHPESVDCNAHPAALTTQFPGSLAIAAPDTSEPGYCYARPHPADLSDSTERSHFGLALASGKLAVGDYMINKKTGEKAIPFALPLPHDATDRPQGVIFASLGLEWLTDNLARRRLPTGYSLTVVDRNGTILARLPERDRIGTTVPASWKRIFAAETPLAQTMNDPITQAGSIFAFEPNSSLAEGVGVAIGIEENAAMAAANHALNRALLIAAFGLLAALVLARLIARQSIERPMQSLLDAAKRWRSGDYTARSALQRWPVEMSRLASAFDAMAESLQLREVERTRNELELRHSRDAALNANLSKTQFLASASHDLRQPLHALSMAVAVMQARHVDDADTAHVERIGRSVRSLSNLLNALLDVSQLDAGLVEPSITNFGVATLFDEIAEQFIEVAAQKDISLHIERSMLAVRSDRQLLGRMIKNLVSNAVKYTPLGGSVRLHSYDDGEHVVIVIADSGIGIAADKQEDVFTDFTQLNNPQRDRNKGLGLGLAIVRRMSKLLTHPVALHSVPGEGSTFSVSVMRSTDHYDDSRSEPIRYHYDGQILLVEDDPLVAEATAELLMVWGAQVTTTFSGEEAVALMQDATLHFDAVIADYRLPQMTGAQVVKAAMARWPAIRAVVVTGNSVDQILREIQMLGAGLLQKPIRTAALVEILRRK